MKKRTFNPFHLWRRLSIKYKLGLTIALMIATLCALLLSTQAQSDFVMETAYEQEAAYYNINALQNTLNDADTALSDLLRSTSSRDVYEAAFYEAFALLETQVAALNTNLSEVSVDEYLLARAIQKGFVSYAEQCEDLMRFVGYNAVSSVLYAYYADVQITTDYLLDTARALQSEALTAGQSNLATLRAENEAQNNLFVLLSLFAILFLIALTSELLQTIVAPILRLADASGAIRDGNFDTPDVVVQSEDELRTLAIAFNDMKRNMKRVFETLQEKNEMEARLHQKELESRENSRLLAQSQMQQLRNQVNPHFLFNTLNIISRTARREKAKKSEKLILSLARLFRYNLKTDDDEVPLLREINIVNDYMSIQTTRFDQRVRLEWNINETLDLARIYVPTFTFQPLIENAVIHGLEPKREGGVIRIRVHVRDGALQLLLTDNGVGMSAQTCANILSAQKRKGDVSGIGVGNVRSRLLLLHPDATFLLRSKEGMGTSVWISIPLHAEQSAAQLASEQLHNLFSHDKALELPTKPTQPTQKISKEQYEIALTHKQEVTQ